MLRSVCGVSSGAVARRKDNRPRAVRLVAILSFAALCTGGCRDVASALGGSPGEARVNADRLLYSLAVRFGPVQQAPGYEEVRSKLSGSALVPSRIFDDSSLWTASNGDVRDLILSGRPTPDGYLLGSRDGPDAPQEPGEYRRSTRLRKVGEDQFEWTVRDELAVGTISSGEVGAALEKLLVAAEHSDPEQIRAAYESNLPRTTRALERLFSLDSIASSPAPGGGTLIFLAIQLDPERIATEFPEFSRFLRRYGSPVQMEVTGEDSSGSTWWSANLDDDRTTVRFRVFDGGLAPLEGAPRPIPDRIRLRANVSTRIKIFDIGASDVKAEVEFRLGPEHTGVTVRFRQEPEWHFPPLVERLIRSSLRRPFAGEGAVVRLWAAPSGERTTLAREYRVTVQESTILRWLGALGSGAFDDFRGGAEQEYDRFVGEFYVALRQDLGVLLR